MKKYLKNLKENTELTKDTELEFLGVIIEFKEGSNDTSYKSMENKLVSLNRMNKYLELEDAKVQDRKTNDGYIGYDKAYIDFIFKLDEKAYRAHLIRVDLGDGVQPLDQDDVNTIKKYVSEFLNGTGSHERYVYEVNPANYERIKIFKGESKMINKKEIKEKYNEYSDDPKFNDNVKKVNKRGTYVKRKKDISNYIYDELEKLGYQVFANTKGGYYVSKKQEQNLDKAKNFLDQNDIEYKPSKFRDRFYLDIVVPGFAMGESLELKIEENKSEPLFYGVPRVKFVYHGDWSDPEVEYEGKIYSYYELEESLLSAFKEECEEKNIEFNSKDFEKWVLKNKDYVYSDLENMSPIKESKNNKGNNKILENSDDVGFRYIETGLTGKINSDILNSVIGQMSDGMWENSPSMEKYWKFVEIEEDNGELLIVVNTEPGKHDKYSKRGYTENKFYSMSADEVKKFFATKIKRIVYEETDGEQWSRDSNTHLDYLSYHEDVQVKDAYKAYETLLGRKTEGKYDDRRTPLRDEIKQWIDEKLKAKGWIFQSELNRDNSKEQEEVNKIINGYGYSTFDSSELLQYVRPSQKSQLLDIIGDNGKIVSKVSKFQVVKDLQSSQIDSQPAVESESKDTELEDYHLYEAVNPENIEVNSLIKKVLDGDSKAFDKIRKLGYEVEYDNTARKDFGRRYFGDRITIKNPKTGRQLNADSGNMFSSHDSLVARPSVDTSISDKDQWNRNRHQLKPGKYGYRGSKEGNDKMFDYKGYLDKEIYSNKKEPSTVQQFSRDKNFLKDKEYEIKQIDAARDRLKSTRDKYGLKEPQSEEIEKDNNEKIIKESVFTLISEFYNIHIENASKEEILEYIEKKMIYVSHDRKHKLSEDLDRMKKSNDTIKFSDFRITLQ